MKYNTMQKPQCNAIDKHTCVWQASWHLVSLVRSHHDTSCHRHRQTANLDRQRHVTKHLMRAKGRRQFLIHPPHSSHCHPPPTPTPTRPPSLIGNSEHTCAHSQTRKHLHVHVEIYQEEKEKEEEESSLKRYACRPYVCMCIYTVLYCIALYWLYCIVLFCMEGLRPSYPHVSVNIIEEGEQCLTHLV